MLREPKHLAHSRAFTRPVRSEGVGKSDEALRFTQGDGSFDAQGDGSFDAQMTKFTAFIWRDLLR